MYWYYLQHRAESLSWDFVFLYIALFFLRNGTGTKVGKIGTLTPKPALKTEEKV